METGNKIEIVPLWVEVDGPNGLRWKNICDVGFLSRSANSLILLVRKISWHKAHMFLRSQRNVRTQEAEHLGA